MPTDSSDPGSLEVKSSEAFPEDYDPMEAAISWLVNQGIRDEVYDQAYYHYSDLRQHMEDLQGENSDIMALSFIGKSVDGASDPLAYYGQLMVARITNLSDPTPKPEVMIDGGHHGNEQLGMETAVLLLDFLVTQYGEDPWVTGYVDSHDTYIFPMLNVDGNTRDTRANSNNVDLNRNYPFEWVDQGNHGSGPACEPEVAANVALFAEHDFQLYISMHTGIRWFLTPWAWALNDTPDAEMWNAFSDEMEAMTGFPAGPAAQDLYIAIGTSLDWAYALGMPSVTIEVDDEQWGLISIEEKQTRLIAAFSGSLYMMENFTRMAAHPVVSNLSAGSAVAEEPVQVTATLTNDGLGPLKNATFWLEGDGFTAKPGEIRIENLSGGNSTELSFRVVPDSSGEIELVVEGQFRELQINTSMPQMLSETDSPFTSNQSTTVPIRIVADEAPPGIGAWLVTSAILLLVVGIVFFVVAVRRR